MNEILSTRDLAIYLGISESSVRARAVEWGGWRVGKLWKFHRDAVLPLVAPKPDTVPDRWQDADPQYQRTTANARRTGRSDGANTDANKNRAGTPPRTKRRTTQTPSASAFAKDFPQYQQRGA